MILINLFINTGKDNELFATDIKSIDFNPLNMDKIRYFIIKYLPKNLTDKFYNISIVNKNKKTTIGIYFEYNIDMIRELKINKLLN